MDVAEANKGSQLVHAIGVWSATAGSRRINRR